MNLTCTVPILMTTVCSKHPHFSRIRYWQFSSPSGKNDGTIIFGGIDKLFQGDLVTLTVVELPDKIERLVVPWTGIDVHYEEELAFTSEGSALDSGVAALLDSGSSLSWIPNNLFADLISAFNLALDEAESYYVGSCGIAKLDGWLDFKFGGKQVIRVPFNQIKRPYPDSKDVYLFGFQPVGDVPPVSWEILS